MTSSDQLPTIQMFWYGPELGRFEQLSLASYLKHDHPVHLYCYNPPSGVPPGVMVRDASEILAEERVFRLSGRQQYYNRGSLAGFADWFRYELLYRRGGIWSDLDMVCLRPFDFRTRSVFAYEAPERINCAVLGLPAGDKLARWMSNLCSSPNRLVPYDTIPRIREKLKRRFLEGNKRDNIQFGEYGPLGLSLAVKHFGREREAMPIEAFYPVHYTDWKMIFDAESSMTLSLDGSYGLHLWNEKARQEAGFNRNGPHPESSLFETLWRRYIA